MSWFKKSLFDDAQDPEKMKWELMGLIRAHLEATDRFSTPELLFDLCKKTIPVTGAFFNSVIDEMIERGFLKQEGEYVMWNPDTQPFPGTKPI